MYSRFSEAILLCASLFASILVAQVSRAAEADHRIALVIGNGAYKNTGPLKNPASDARLIASRLKSLGFETMLFADLEGSQMRRAVRAYSERLMQLGPNTIGLIYYAGHGVQIRENNYLIPVDAEINKESDAGLEAIHLADVMNMLFDAQNKLNVIVLDACRNNPFKKKIQAASSGLAGFDAPVGTLVAFAAGAGSVAFDGDGSNSPYAEALAAALLDPALKVEDTFKRVSERVYVSTEKKQLPWITAAVHGEYFLASNAVPQVVAANDRAGHRAGVPRSLPPVPSDISNNIDPELEGRIAYFIEWRFFAGDNGAQKLGPEAYAERLDYYGEVSVPREKVLDDKLKYYQRWPNRRFSLVRNTLKVKEVAQDVLEVVFDFKFDVENATKRSVGLSTMKLGLLKDGGDFIIFSQNEEIRDRKISPPSQGQAEIATPSK